MLIIARPTITSVPSVSAALLAVEVVDLSLEFDTRVEIARDVELPSDLRGVGLLTVVVGAAVPRTGVVDLLLDPRDFGAVFPCSS